MSQDRRSELSSPPCLQGEREAEHAAFVPPQLSLMNGLARVLGIAIREGGDALNYEFLARLARMFEPQHVDAGTVLVEEGQPWSTVFFVQYGILKLFRQAPGGRIATHQFFTEGAVVWPLFVGSRSSRNTLYLDAATSGQVWAADFLSFRCALKTEGLWNRFALALTEELAELAIQREYRRQTMSASERYRLLIDEHDDLFRRLPGHQLAAWMGVDRATFSRIKSAHARQANVENGTGVS